MHMIFPQTSWGVLGSALPAKKYGSTEIQKFGGREIVAQLIAMAAKATLGALAIKHCHHSLLQGKMAVIIHVPHAVLPSHLLQVTQVS